MTERDFETIPIIVEPSRASASGLVDSTRPTRPEPTCAAIASYQALEIAEADAGTAYRDLSSYRIELWLDDDGWHVEYHIRQTKTSRFLTGGGPFYVIHPETGEIVSKKYYQ